MPRKRLPRGPYAAFSESAKIVVCRLWNWIFERPWLGGCARLPFSVRADPAVAVVAAESAKKPIRTWRACLPLRPLRGRRPTVVWRYAVPAAIALTAVPVFRTKLPSIGTQSVT